MALPGVFFEQRTHLIANLPAREALTDQHDVVGAVCAWEDTLPVPRLLDTLCDGDVALIQGDARVANNHCACESGGRVDRYVL